MDTALARRFGGIAHQVREVSGVVRTHAMQADHARRIHQAFEVGVGPVELGAGGRVREGERVVRALRVGGNELFKEPGCLPGRKCH